MSTVGLSNAEPHTTRKASTEELPVLYGISELLGLSRERAQEELQKADEEIRVTAAGSVSVQTSGQGWETGNGCWNTLVIQRQFNRPLATVDVVL